MATTESRTKSSGGHKYVDFDEFIDYQVRKTRSGIRSTDLLTSVVVLALAVTTYLLAFIVADHWVITGGIGFWPRVVSLSLLGMFVVGWTAWKIVIPYLRQVSSLFAAREIEQVQPDLKSSLLTLIDLKRAGRAVAPHIVAAMEKRAAKRLSAADIEQAVDRRLLMRLSYVLLVVVAAMCAYTVFSPKSISSSVMRALLPSSSLTVSTRTRIEAVDPGDAEVLARSLLEVTVDLAGEIPESATLLYTSSDRSFVDEPITLRDTGEGLNRFRGVLAGPNGRGLLQNLTYRIVAGDAESRDYQVTVKQAPYATVTEVFLDYPEYMRLDDKSQTSGDIDAWEGTTITVRAETNMPVATGTIQRSSTDDAALGSDSLPMEFIDDTHLEVTWRLEFDEGVPYRFYRIEVETEAGATDPRPRFYSVNIRRDIPPVVRILHPTGDLELPANGALPVAWQALDPDFMLRHVRMHFEQIGADPDRFSHKTRHLFEAPPGQSNAGGIDEVQLSEFNLEPGDVLSLWLEAKDNQAPLGTEDGNTTRTSRINITILDPVSRDEAEQQLEQQHEQLQQELEESQQESGEAGDEQDGTEGDADGMTGDVTQEESQDATGENGEETTAAGQTPGDENGETQTSDSTDGNEQTTGEAGTQPGDEEAGEGSETGPDGEQPGTEPSADGEQDDQPSGASDEAEDHEALHRLIEEYEALEQAQQEREQQEQQQEDAEDPQADESEPSGDGPQSPDSDGQGGESPSGPESPSDSDSGSGGPDQSADDADGTGRPPGDTETTSDGATGGEQTPSDDPAADARPGDVENDQEGTPTDDEGPAEPQRATGDEEGTGRPETDPDAEATPADEPIEREGDDPATRPTEQPSDETGEGMPQDTGGGENPEGAEPAPDTDGEPSDSPGDRGSSQSGMPEADRPPARSDQQPSGPDQSDPESGAEDGQRSEQPSPGEQGTGTQASEGTQGGSEQGPGDATSSPGSQTDAEGEPGGQPGDQPGEGSTSQPQGDQPGGSEGTSEPSGEGGESGGGEGGESGSESSEVGGEGGGEGSQGGGEGGEGGGEGGSSGGSEGPQSEGGEGGDSQGGGGTSSQSGGGGGGGAGSQAPAGSGGGGAGADSGPMNPNLEDKRRASELVLERLQDQLERGEAPEELLDDLGWTEDKLRDFMGRLEDRLADTGEDTSPEAEARRRQFETILEGIDYASEGQQREAGDGPRDSAEGFGSQRRSVPPEFQALQEEYRRRLSQQNNAD